MNKFKKIQLVDEEEEKKIQLVCIFFF